MAKPSRGRKSEAAQETSEETITKNWTLNSGAWNAGYNDSGDPLRECLLPVERVLAWLADSRRIIDAGCGGGYLARRLAAESRDVTAVDISPGQIEIARTAAKEKLPPQVRDRISYFTASLTRLSKHLPCQHFDAAVCTTVVENIEDYERAIVELGKCLKPGGRLVLTVVHPCFSMKSLKKLRSEQERTFVRAWQIENYYERGVSSTLYEGMPAPTITFHRTLGDYSRALLTAGFLISGLEEPMPTEKQIKQFPGYLAERGSRIPRFLVFIAERTANG